MSSILRKVKSLPALIKKRKSSRKLEKLCGPIYESSPPRPRNWLFLEHCRLLEDLTNYFIALYQDENEEEVWYWANDIDEKYPMTYRLNSTSMVSDSLLFDQRIDSPSTTLLTTGQQMDLTRYFKNY